MSQSTISNGSQNCSGQTVSVPRPENGANVTAVSSPGGFLELGFDPSIATASRVDNSLVFEVDGGTVTLTDFFAVGDQGLPSLCLPDGTEVASADFFANSDLDISTAEGATAPGTTPSGGASYADDSGDLLGGVDRLGSLGTDFWTRSTETAELFAATRGAGAAAPAAPAVPSVPGPVTPGPVTPGPVTPEPEVPSIGNDLRAVLYMHGALQTNNLGGRSVSTHVFFKPENGERLQISAGDISSFNGAAQNPAGGYAVTTSLPEGWDASWVSLSFDKAAGRIVISLTAQGFQALKESGDKLLDYFKVTVTDNATGQSFDYNTQVVITTAPEFNSHEQDLEDAASGAIPGLDLGGEYHSADGRSPAGTSGEKYHIVGSAGNDEIIINERFSNGSEIWASAKSGTELTGADDKNSIYLKQGMEARGKGVVNTIDSSGGEIVVGGHATSSSYWSSIAAHDGGTNIINAEDLIVSTAGRTGNPNNQWANAIYASGEGSRNEITLSGDLKATLDDRIASVITSHNKGVNEINVAGQFIVRGDGNGSIIKAESLNPVNNTGSKVNATFGGIDVDIATSGTSASRLISASGNQPGLQGSQVTILSDGEVNIKAEGAGGITGIYTYSPGSEVKLSTTEGNSINMSLHGTSGSVFTSHYGGKNIVESGQDFTAELTGTGGLEGMYATFDGGNSITAKGDVTLNLERNASSSTSTTMWGMYAGGATNSIEAGGKTTISMRDESKQDTTSPGAVMRAITNSVNSITSESVELEFYRPGAGNGASLSRIVYGMDAAGGQNLINADTDVSLTTTGNYTFAMGAVGGKNEITAGESVRVTANGGEGDGSTMYTANNGQNLIHAKDVILTASGGAAINMGAGGGGQNLIDASQDVILTATGGHAYGMNAGNGKNAIIAGESVNITANIGDESGAAMYATSKGENLIDAKNVTLTASGGLSAYGMDAAGGKNQITAGESAHISANSGKGGAMYATSGGQNIILAAQGSQGITVVIEAEGIANWAMYAAGANSVNRITGSAEGNDSISITGDVYATGGGKNIIETGDGDNIISLQGKIQAGALNIVAGEGTDLLILNASSVEEFNDFYKSWLEGMGADAFKNMNIEKVTVNIALDGSHDVGDLSKLSWLDAYSGDINYVITGNDHDNTLIGGAGDDILIAGGGDNILTGGDGADTFVFLHKDIGDGTHVNTITDFSLKQGDLLDLRDLLPDVNAGSLDTYLGFSKSLDGHDMVLSVSSKGNGHTDMTIVLKDAGGMSEADLLTHILTNTH